MQFARRRAEFNRRFVNPVVRPLAGHLPLWSAVDHVGRRSGRQYRTPVTAIPTLDGVAILLPYGVDTDWVRNLQAAGTGTVLIGGRSLPVRDPRVVSTAEAAAVTARPWQRLLRILPVKSALLLTRSS
ncbi:deazaflavin-dependent oxidoreductase, nitroreductase family [Mycolicibacterium neoaurum]|uniref:nitroreductase family deazaflavin-dependent oxidoreductase n=1 Tax=Mycolicibacterium neoaurum TaxID=1795 RepID=UPI0005637F2F|nr:nitroreductase family deazaflavin-dependent oxidoreductase [Mycolicibacterium neoaurum]SDD04918.1 deazaflavin-dependent oxidoreductase, nitroreductase family [Mycolicibacterium neoaurum]